ncbi:MFS transporter [Chloroflexota bacterium]
MLAHFSHHMVSALAVPLLPFIRDDFALDYTQSGFLISAFTLAYGISQLPGGWLADRIGPRILITTGICGVALAGFLVGLSHTYFMMMVFLVMMGVLGGGYHPSSPPLVSASVEPRHRGRALGLHMMGGSASFFLAPLVAAAIAGAWGWRSSFIGLAIPTIAFGFLFYVLLGRRADKKAVDHRIADSHDKTSFTPSRLRPVVAFMTLSAFTSAILFSIVAFMPLFMVDHFGVSEKTGAALISIIYSGGLWASLLGGYLSDRLGKVPVMITACFIAGPVVYMLTLAPYGLGTYTLLLIVGMFIYIRMPISEAYIIGHTPERHRSTILGIYYFGGMEGSGVLTPIIGSLIDHFGFYPSFTIIAAALVAVTLACSVFLWGSKD